MSFKAVQKAMVEWAVTNQAVVVEAVRHEAPEGPKRQLEMFSTKDASTTLKASIRGRVRGRTDNVRIEVLAGVSYALIIRDGRATVVPKNAKVLHWVDEEGRDVFAMKSKAVPPNPYGHRGWERVRKEVRADLARRVGEAALKDLLKTAQAGGMQTRLG